MTALDRLIQLFYRCVYPLGLLYWRLTKGSSHGVQVAFWLDDRVLLVKNSYRTGYSFPGGDVKKGERSVDAARRELKEETGIVILPDQLRFAMDIRYRHRNLDMIDEIFECNAPIKPMIHIDNREVIEAEYFTLDEALSQSLLESTRSYLTQKCVRVSKNPIELNGSPEVL